MPFIDEDFSVYLGIYRHYINVSAQMLIRKWFYFVCDSRNLRRPIRSYIRFSWFESWNFIHFNKMKNVFISHFQLNGMANIRLNMCFAKKMDLLSQYFFFIGKKNSQIQAGGQTDKMRWWLKSCCERVGGRLYIDLHPTRKYLLWHYWSLCVPYMYTKIPEWTLENNVLYVRILIDTIGVP